MHDPKGQAVSFIEPTTQAPIDRLIFGRLVVVVLILLASWWWTGSYLHQSTGTFPTTLFLFFFVSIALTGIYHVIAFFNTNYAVQRRIQFFIDVLLVTWLVWETGDINSPYRSLYIVLVCLAGFMMGKAETYAVAAAAAICFISLAVLTGQEIIYSLSGDVPVSRAVQVVGVNTVAILLVGLMSGRIAEKKRTDDELRKSRESFEDLNLLHERILQSVDTGLITTDLDGTIYGFNRAAEIISGYSRANALRRPIADVCGPELGATVAKDLDRIRAGDSLSDEFETSLRTPDDKHVDVVCSTLPLLKRSGAVTGLILTIQDVSKIRALEASLRQADRLAAVGRMAAGLAHEIRNPLGSLGSSLQFLRERVPADSSERTLFDVVLRESERLNSIITNFLSYARPKGTALRSREETDIDAALRDCLTLMKHDPKVTTAHQFRYEPPAVPMKSRISETQVKQVMWNLLQNSVNAMPDGGDISVRLDQSSSGIRMLFQDSGPGFSPESLQHLYEPFSIASDGTGLGLSIVHKIVNEHGGRIDVERSSGQGATIVVELPR